MLEKEFDTLIKDLKQAHKAEMLLLGVQREMIMDSCRRLQVTELETQILDMKIFGEKHDAEIARELKMTLIEVKKIFEGACKKLSAEIILTRHI